MNINWLNSAIEAFSRNDRPGARNFLHAYVAEHPDDERGWFWMSRVAEHPGEKVGDSGLLRHDTNGGIGRLGDGKGGRG